MLELPTGTGTFLLSDVEDCRQLSVEHPQAIKPALASYHRLLQQAVEAHGGHLYQAVDDALYAGFARAESAAAAALQAQRDLQATEWDEIGCLPVRMALQTGSLWAADGNYAGITANRAARLLRLGHGGQVLISSATWQQINGRLPDGVELRDLGEHGLMGLVPPERVFQLVTPGLLSDFAPLGSLETCAHNLPTQLTRFIGRDRIVDEVERLLATTRLLTLVGAGGIGKTRLALHVAGDMLGVHQDGVWQVELSGVSDPVLVPLAVASVFGVREEPERLLLDTLADYLKDKHVLLVLDYCEHLIEACAELSETLLYACPKLRLLVTSREPLDIPDEATWSVLSLATPDLERLSFTDRDFVSTLMEYESVRLFDERAKSVMPSFILTNENALTVAQICRRLDGIPLAIELAAAMVPELSVDKIAERLNERFRLLTGGRHTAMPKDRTLRIVIGWSYGALSEAEQMLLRRLSVFVGGCTADVAEIVCWGRGLETDLIAGLLARLESRALAIVDRQSGTARYSMLEAIRQYSRDELLDAGETAWVQGRFLDFYLRLAEETEARLQGAEQSVWLEWLEVEYDNLRAALEWGQASHANAEAGLRLAGALWAFWYLRGKLSEGRLWLEGALTGARGGTSARAKVFNAAGHLAYMQGDLIAARLFYEESLAIRRESGDKRGIVHSLHSLGQVLKAQGEYGQAERLYEESLAVSREMGNNESVAISLYDLGCVLVCRGNTLRAAGILRESLRLWRGAGNALRVANCLVNLGQTAAAAGTRESALKAVRLLGAASILLDTIASSDPSDRAEYDHSLAAARTLLEETAVAAAWAEGRGMTREQAVAYALEP